jgi:hypothetical protein
MSKEGAARRVIVPPQKYHSEELSPGVVFNRFYPGGKEGPNGEIHYDKPGGQAWTEYMLLGSREDPFQLLLPDIRMPANQYWPLHWHDAWTVVLVLEGSCVVGDWQMQPGDVFITEPSIEYGPLLIGPYGCRLLEIFAQAHLANGGYAPEYRDHPTLQGTDAQFKERSALNSRNDGHQVLSLEGVEGIVKTRLAPGARWDLGNSDDPDRGFMCDTRLSAGEMLPGHKYGDWHAILVLDGSIEIRGTKIEKDGYLVVSPDSPVDRITAGTSGAQLLELARTARGAERLALV